MTDPIMNGIPDRGLSRRDLLQGGVAASLTAAFLSGCGGGSSPAPSLGSSSSISAGNMPKGFSREELARRWQLVRERMKEQGFDCLIASHQAENNADVRYLTDSRDAPDWVVFPLEGNLTAIFDGARAARETEAKKDWGIDVRTDFEGTKSAQLIACLRELNMTQARIGVGNLSGVLRNEEGGLSYTTFDRILRAFPRATFESAADMLMRVKLVHSEEEIAVFEKLQEASEAGLQALLDTARPGLVHRDVWIHVYHAMLAATGEPPTRLSITAGGNANVTRGYPVDEVLRPGLIVSQEIDATLLGMRSQCNQSFLLGSPAPADWPSAAQYCIDLYHNMVDWIAPGKSFKDLTELYGQQVRQRSGENVRVGGVMVHTGGWGDGPRLGAGRSEGLDDLLIEAGMIFTMKPSVPIQDLDQSAQFGDAVVVTENGARRLGKRKLEVLTIGA
ncbi:MAG: aminopeptidase P family protein [Acidobacteria bacterium]|nr:aminopeptidase P family protein [Acidobacteriota bacterium]